MIEAINFGVQLLACNKYSSANYGFKRFNYIHSFDSRNICIGRKMEVQEASIRFVKNIN